MGGVAKKSRTKLGCENIFAGSHTERAPTVLAPSVFVSMWAKVLSNDFNFFSCLSSWMMGSSYLDSKTIFSFHSSAELTFWYYFCALVVLSIQILTFPKKLVSSPCHVNYGLVHSCWE